MDVWSLEMLKVPSFFLYAADPLTFVAAFSGVILQDQYLFDSLGPSSRRVFTTLTQELAGGPSTSLIALI